MLKKIYFFLLGGLIIMASCSTGDAVTTAKMTGSSSKALLFLNCRAVSEDEIEFEFSQPVTVTSLNFEPALAAASIENGSTVKVRLEESAESGTSFTADILAEDADKNTINVLVQFRSRNNRMPKLVINELNTEYSNPRTEFIEFKMETAGNLGALRVFFAGNNTPYVYEFKPVEVKEGDYVTLHLRTVEASCKDEYGDDLAESGGKNSSSLARDFWVEGNTKLLHKANSFVYVLDQDDQVLAAVMISEKPDAWWGKEHLASAAEFLFENGAWTSADGTICSPADAVSSNGVTATRTICRDETVENTNTAADWYITATSGLSPGGKNNEKRYVP